MNGVEKMKRNQKEREYTYREWLEKNYPERKSHFSVNTKLIALLMTVVLGSYSYFTTCS